MKGVNWERGCKNCFYQNVKGKNHHKTKNVREELVSNPLVIKQ